MANAKRSKIEIRAARAGDYAALAQLYSGRNAYSQTLQLPFPSHEVWRKRQAENDDNHHTLIATIGGEVVGNLGLTRLTRARRSHVGEIGMGVSDSMQGRGVGTALMQAALDLADNWLALRRIELRVYADNARAIALYRKFGFEVEGTHRLYAVRDGAYVDSLSMARIVDGPRIGAKVNRKSKRARD